MPDPVEKLAYWLLKDINKAVYDFNMIQDGDRIAVAVSGGMDSLSLLALLDYRRKFSPEKYSLVILHVVGDARGPDCPRHEPLVDWIENYGLDYHIEPLHLPNDELLPLDCHRCTWNRKKTIFKAASQANCGVVALGHHADDLAETTLLNLLFHGKVETMSPTNDYFDGALKLIRPLCYIPKKKIMRYAKAAGFPEPPPACPRSSITKRKFMRDLIHQAERHSPEMRLNLLRAGLKGNGFQQNQHDLQI